MDQERKKSLESAMKNNFFENDENESTLSNAPTTTGESSLRTCATLCFGPILDEHLDQS